MKQIIRLTESKLRRFIAETVRETISELDWRTYSSASKKSINRALTRDGTMYDYKRGLDFAAASEDAFVRDYGYANKDDGEKSVDDFVLGKTTYIPRSKGGRGWANYNESLLREDINNSSQNNYTLYTVIRYVDEGADDYDKICKLYERNPQRLIKYLAQWDGDECELEEKKPKLSRYEFEEPSNDNSYTLLYDPTIGGCFLLYRNATQNEIDWYKENH